MKKAFQIITYIIIFFGAVGMLVNYFFTKRHLQEHAQCIPPNAFMVVTLNVKQLAMDFSSEGISTQKISSSDLFSKELKPLYDAITNGNSGINKTEDILGFMYQSGDAAFMGITISINNQEKVSSLMKDKLSKSNFSFLALTNYKVHLFQLDTTSAILGWNDQSLLLLYPFGNSTARETSDECAKLLSQTKEKSILSNENFCSEQLNSFDANIWIHASPLLAFSGGGTFYKTQLDGVDYLNMNVEFRDGEIDIRKIVTTDGKTNNIPGNLIITGDPKNVLGFIRVPMNFENKNLTDAYLYTSPLSQLPFEERDLKKLLETFNGNNSILFHDTIYYDRNLEIKLARDTGDSEYKQVNEKVKATAMSYCFGLKDEAMAKKIFAAIALRDSFPFSNSSWTFTGDFFNNEPTTKFFIADNVFTMTTDPNSDGRARPVPDQWEGMDLQINLGDYFRDEENNGLFFFLPQSEAAKKILSANLGSMTISQPAIESNKESSTIIIRMKNKKTNSLIQLENLAEKIMLENN